MASLARGVPVAEVWDARRRHAVAWRVTAMSELQAVCDALRAIDGDILQMAQQLHVKSQAYTRAAANATAAARSAEGEGAAALARTAAAFSAAARHCSLAAQSLTGASRDGEAYVQRTVGGGSAVAMFRGQHAGTGDISDAASAWPGEKFGLSCSMTNNGGINLLPPTDDAGQMASEVEALPGFTDVVIHGNPYDFGTRDGPSLTAAELGEVIDGTASLAHRPIRLLACKAGHLEGGAAQQLADCIGQPVLAPSDSVFLVGRPGRVRMVVGPNEFTNSGHWRIFRPRTVGAGS